MTGETETSASEPQTAGTRSTVPFDWDGNCAIDTAVLAAAESVTGRSPTDLPRLHHVVDADALQRVFEPRCEEARPTDGTVSFQYAGCDVTVFASGKVTAEITSD